MRGVRIRMLAAQHWRAVERIYAAGVASGHATFEERPPSWTEFDAVKLPGHRWVALAGGRDPSDEQVVGWVAASATSRRRAYAGVVAESVYVDPAWGGRGVGSRLLSALVVSTEAAGIWTIEAGIFPENAASLRLHERAGFRVVGIRERVGRMPHGPMAGRWRDVVLVERRSHLVGWHPSPPEGEQPARDRVAR